MNWLDFKDEAARLVLEKDALHIYAAVTIQLVAAALSRRSVGHLLPWLAVLGFEVGNEALDILLGDEPHIRAWQVMGGIHDLINTMVVPTVLLWVCRHAPWLFAWPRPASPRGAVSLTDDR